MGSEMCIRDRPKTAMPNAPSTAGFWVEPAGQLVTLEAPLNEDTRHMFFNQFRAYRITSPEFKIDAATLEEALKTKPARKPESQELTAIGFLPPFGNDKNGPLVVAADGYLLVNMRTNERILPGSVVRDELKDKVDEIEASQSRKVYKKERDQLKDEIIQALLPPTSAGDRCSPPSPRSKA